MNEEQFRDWVWDNWFAMGESGHWAATLVVGHLKRKFHCRAEDAVRDLHRHGITLHKQAPDNPVHMKTVAGATVLGGLMGLELPEV